MADDAATREGPLLIDRSNDGLDRYLRDYPQVNFTSLRQSGGVRLDAWLALGKDASEASSQMAKRLGVPLVRLARLEPDAGVLAHLTPALARQLRAVPLRAGNGVVAVAMENPAEAAAQNTIDFLSSEHVVALVATPHDIREAIARFYDQVEDREVVRQLGLDPATTSIENEQEAQRLAREAPVVRIVKTLINDAVKRRASDIHLRPGALGTDALSRIDDEMVPVRRLMRALHPAVVSRIKVLASMNLAEHRRPQDGRTSHTMEDGRRIDKKK